ncbi:hypothetical protein E4U22_006050 [Claviceps purpurea]|nr:hypothetical protein E4U37_002393 [Claviceps purpurea]KAG6186758.1 hypothetical protein E4U36_000358 [Claviceps purpurea]KAG6229650.1 hypothetical protein E4U26_008542 [Claviceps purpurea]KAG6232440.1 hypothetical protein E4U25_006711 [Claviceps purpurea]KAG6254550.1 hypothetical protein E4U23_005966 [Claviceps purpurea]
MQMRYDDVCSGCSGGVREACVSGIRRQAPPRRVPGPWPGPTADGRINLAWESSPGALLMLALAGSEASPYSAVQDCSLSCWRDAKPSSKTAPEKPEHQEDPEDPASFKSADIAPRA